MNIALWIAQGLLALVFLGSAVPKLVYSAEKAAGAGIIATGFTLEQTRVIGVLEVLAVAGLVLPGITGILPILVPFAAIGLAVIMVGALVIHLRERDVTHVLGCAVLMLVAVFVAWGRLVAQPL